MLPTRRSQNWLPGIFNDFFGNEWMEKSTSPAINIIENDKEYKVELAAPGLTKEDFNVRVTEENQLVVTMEKKQEQKDEQQDSRTRNTSRHCCCLTTWNRTKLRPVFSMVS